MLLELKQQMKIMDSILPAAAKNEIMEGRLPQLNSEKILLRKNEYCHYVDKAILNIYMTKEITYRIGHSMPGIFKGTHINVGTSKSKEYQEIKQQKGILYITNKRMIFQATKNSFDKQHRYLSTIEPYNNAVVLQYGKSTYEIIVEDGFVINRVLKLINQ